MEYGSNGIVVFTNSGLVCNQMNGVCQVKKERLKKLHGIANNIVSQFKFFSIRHCSNVNKMSVDIVRGAMPNQDSSIKDELELYREIPIQDSSLKDELVLRCSFSKIQDSSLKDELVLRRSPSKFIDGHCNIPWICVCCVLINVSFLMTMCFFNYIPSVFPPHHVKHNLVTFTFASSGELHIFIKLKCEDFNKFLFKWSFTLLF